MARHPSQLAVGYPDCQHGCDRNRRGTELLVSAETEEKNYPRPPPAKKDRVTYRVFCSSGSRSISPSAKSTIAVFVECSKIEENTKTFSADSESIRPSSACRDNSIPAATPAQNTT